MQRHQTIYFHLPGKSTIEVFTDAEAFDVLHDLCRTRAFLSISSTSICICDGEVTVVLFFGSTGLGSSFLAAFVLKRAVDKDVHECCSSVEVFGVSSTELDRSFMAAFVVRRVADVDVHECCSFGDFLFGISGCFACFFTFFCGKFGVTSLSSLLFRVLFPEAEAK